MSSKILNTKPVQENAFYVDMLEFFIYVVVKTPNKKIIKFIIHFIITSYSLWNRDYPSFCLLLRIFSLYLYLFAFKFSNLTWSI